MRAASVAGLVLASLTKLAIAEDLLFYNDMLYKEYSEATTTLGYTAHIATDAEWRGYTSADFAKYKAIIIPDPNCGTIDKIKFLDDTKSVWSPAVTGNMIIIGTDPTYHSTSRSGAINLIDDSVRFAASGSKGTGLYFSLSCYYDSGDVTTISSLSKFGTFYVRGKLACYNDAHLVSDAPELDSLEDSNVGNWSCSVHEVFTEFPKLGIEPGTDGFVSFAIARNATGDGEESYADGSSGIPYIIARGATPVGCGDGKIEDAYGEECDNGKDVNGTPGNPCSTSCKCYFGVASPGVCKTSNTTSSSSSSMSSSSTVISNSSTALPSTPANSTLPASMSMPDLTTSSTAPSSNPASAAPPSSLSPGVTTVIAESSRSSPALPVPSNSSNPAVPPPPVTVTASAGAPTAPSAEPSAPGTPAGPPPPITIITTIDGPTPSVITVIATPEPTLSAGAGSSSGPPPPITIVTTIGGPVPSVITIIATRPSAAPSAPAPGASGSPSAADPSNVTSATTIGAPGAGPSSPASPGSTTVLTVGGPGAGGSWNSSAPAPFPSAGPSDSGGPVSASPSFVTVVTSVGADNSAPGNLPVTSAPGKGPSDNPSSGPSATGSVPGSTETSVRTVFATAPGGGNAGPGSPSSGSGSAPANASSVAPVPGNPTSVATSVQTIVNTIGAPGSDGASAPGNSAPSGAPSSGAPATGAAANPTLSGSATRSGPAASGTGTSTSTDVSYLSALHSGSPSSGTSGTPDASGSMGSGSAAPTSTDVSGSSIAPDSGAPASTGGTGTGDPGASGTAVTGASTTDGAGADVPSASRSGPNASSSSAFFPANSSTTLSSSDGSLSAVNASTSLPGNPRPSMSNSAGTSVSLTRSPGANYTGLPTDGPGISKNGTIFTALSNTASGNILPTTLATTTMPAGPDSTCDIYIGIEVIEFIEITEVCPEGATITETLTTCLSTMTRPICHTSTPGYPCYPCMGLTPSSGDTATVTRSSCSTSTPLTTTLTGQLCHTCLPLTYTTTSIPGYTSGGCKDCSSYTSGALTLPSTTTTVVDMTDTNTATVRLSSPKCHHCPDAAPTDGPDAGGPVPGVPVSGTVVGGGDIPVATTVPGNPGLPNTTGGSGGGGYGGGAPTPTSTVSTPATVPKPSAAPSYVTAAGGPRGVVWELGTGVAAAVVWAVMMM